MGKKRGGHRLPAGLERRQPEAFRQEPKPCVYHQLPQRARVVFFPMLMKFEDLRSKYCEYGKVIGINRSMCRELFATFSKAGLKSIDVHPLTLSFTQRYPDILKRAIHGGPLLLKATIEEMISHGFITLEDFENALKEVDVWLQHPDSFFMGSMVFAIGKVTHS